MSSYMYVFWNPYNKVSLDGNVSDLFKVGKIKNPEQRLLGLRCGGTSTSTYHSLYKFDSDKEAYACETTTHNFLDKHGYHHNSASNIEQCKAGNTTGNGGHEWFVFPNADKMTGLITYIRENKTEPTWDQFKKM